MKKTVTLFITIAILLTIILMNSSCSDDNSTTSSYITTTSSDMGLIKISIADVYVEPNTASPLATQAIMGEKIKILEIKEGLASIELPDQYDYPGWIKISDILQGQDYSSEIKRLVVKTPETYVYETPSTEKQIASLLMGAIPGGINYGNEYNGFTRIVMPDGKTGWIMTNTIGLLDKKETDKEKLVEKAKNLKGTLYLWGGMSNKGFDCSGFIHILFRSYGIKLHRDSDLHFYYDGTTVENNNLQIGDLLFFNNSSGEVSHDGIYIGNDEFIHSSSKYGAVVISPMSEYASIYRGAKRIIE